MKHDVSKELFLYWNRLRGSRPAPKRSEIEPADIRTRLADTFILEAKPNGAARFRLAGTRICAIFARELKGFDVDTLISDRDRMMVARLIQAAIREGTVSVLGLDGVTRRNRRSAHELVLLPLASEADGARIMGSLVALNPLQQQSPADPVLRCEVTSVRVVDPDREPMFLKNRPEIPVPPLAPGSELFAPADADVFAEEADFISDAQPSRKIFHLRVFDGGKDQSER